eukprot:308349-Chlamydomonas_euryale.AAC.2
MCGGRARAGVHGIVLLHRMSPPPPPPCAHARTRSAKGATKPHTVVAWGSASELARRPLPNPPIASPTRRRGKGLGIDFFHCMNCNSCMSLSVFNTHTCREKALEGDCPVCSEYLFDSAQPIKVCGVWGVDMCGCARVGVGGYARGWGPAAQCALGPLLLGASN